MKITLIIIFTLLTMLLAPEAKRNKRFLILTPSTQFGVFVTVSIPLEKDSLTSVAWFFEANYNVVENSTYFEPLIQVNTFEPTRRSERSVDFILTRALIYTFIENMLKKYELPGRQCLLRAICDHVHSHTLQNGVFGDILHILLTPTSSELEEELDDCYYVAEYMGLRKECETYHEGCPVNLVDFISIVLE